MSVILRSNAARTLLMRSSAMLRPMARFSSPAMAKLNKVMTSELQHEKDQYEQPGVIKQFLKDQVWTFDDTEGDVNMVLRRSVGDRNVTIEWQLASPYDAEGDFEGEEGQQQQQQSEPQEATDFTITVETKSGSGMVFYCSTDSGEGHRFVIGNVRSFQSADERDKPSAYNGPEFEDLDDSLQETFDEYLAELGLNDSVCDFIDASALDKEQREYMRWLKNIKELMA